MTATVISQAREQYWTDGYTVLRGVFGPEEIERYRQECGRLWALEGLDDDLNLRTEFRRGPDGEWAFDRLDPVIDISPPLASAARHPDLLAALEAILGGSPELLKCKLIRKEPGVNGYATHQDYLYWKWLDMHPDSLCTVVVSLYPSDETSGGVGLYRASHQQLLQGPAGNPDGDVDPAQLNPAHIEVPAVQPGDVLLFHSLAPHFSGRNDSDLPRTALLPSYLVTEKSGVYEQYYRREIIRRCQEMVGFERHFERLDAL